MYQEDSFKTSQVVYAHTRSDEADMEYKMHCHNSYEIYYMVKGNVEYFLEATSYVPKPGSLLIIPPNCFHGLRVLDGSEYHRIRLHFVPELLTEKEKQLLLGILGKSWGYMEEQFRAEWYFNSLEECGSYSRELQDIAIRARIVSFLTYLSAMYEKGVGRGPGKEDVAQEILRYINEHLTEHLTLEGLAEKFYMSKNHLTAIFKRAAGTTVARYILYKRMTIARKELAGGTPAAEAALKAGFGDYSSFFRAYRKMFGCAPSDQQAMELPDMDKSGDF